MTNFIGWFAALVAGVTGLAMLQDALAMPLIRSVRGVAQHWARLAALIMITASALVLVVFPSERTATGYEVMLRVALASFMAMQSPCPWWRYVLQGLHRPKARKVVL